MHQSAEYGNYRQDICDDYWIKIDLVKILD